jgi:hypothetical protein
MNASNEPDLAPPQGAGLKSNWEREIENRRAENA